MGLFLSFLGGAAKGFVEDIESSEKDAKLSAVNSVKSMAERMNKVREENTKLATKLKEEKQYLLDYYPNATPEQINEILARPAVMEAIKKYKDPTSISLDSLVKVSKANESDALAAEKVAALPDIVERARALTAPSMVMRRNPLGRAIDEFGASAYRSAAQQTAAALGTTMEEIAGTTPLQRPTPRGQVDMSVLSETKLEDVKDKTKMEMFKAREAGDENKLQQAAVKMANIILTEESIATKNKTEQQIQSELITKIQETQDPKEKTVLTAQLRQRQQLAKLPGEGKTDADKLTANNLMTAASRAVTSAVSDRLPPGSFMIAVDPTTGAQTLTLKELGQAEQYKKGMEAGRTAAIQQMTNPQTRQPLSDLHKNALFSIGVAFDQQGRAVLPTVESPVPTGSKKSTPAAAPAPAASAAAAPTKQLKYNPKTGKWE